VDLPWPAQAVQATVYTDGKTPIELSAYAADGTLVGSAKSQNGGGQPQQLAIAAQGMVRLLFGTGVIEGTLIELCATEDSDAGR